MLRFGRWCLFVSFGVFGERNLRCFEDLESSMEDILALFFSYVVSLDGDVFVPTDY